MRLSALNEAMTAWLLDKTRQATWILLALGVVAFVIVGANRPANPRLVPPQGVVTDSGSSGPGWAAGAHSSGPLLARTPTPRARPLVGRTWLSHPHARIDPSTK